MKILILGASSYVGARLYLDLAKNHEVVGTYAGNKLCKDFIQLDITDPLAVSTIFKNTAPEVVVHVANSADARWCEANPEEARELNEISSIAIAKEAKNINTKLIYISSFAAIDPENVYGETKRASEEIIKNQCDDWLILRPSLIVGFSPNTTNDRPFNRFLKNIDDKTKAEYDNSWKFQPTYLGHISEIIEQLLNKHASNLVLPIAVNEITTRYQLASDILSDFKINVTPLETTTPPPSFKEDLSILDVYKLKKYTYKDMVGLIIDEIKNREKFTLT